MTQDSDLKLVNVIRGGVFWGTMKLDIRKELTKVLNFGGYSYRNQKLEKTVKCQALLFSGGGGILGNMKLKFT